MNEETANELSASINEEDRNEQLVPNNFSDIGADMDLVNGPNPWLPAYGFQIQHRHNPFQPTDDEDLHTNESTLVQQVDFLETILEETSDDLQSDSDRSGTTYWLGSDSETESVIHIKANQRASEPDARPEGSNSGSDCNSVVPKKRRRRNATGECESSINIADWASPHSSRSSSSRSSSLIQFENLERTCATVSPSGYSYDSLEFSNPSNSRLENTSPDSLEVEDEDEDVENRLGLNNQDFNSHKIRPFRSFESLDTCHQSDIISRNSLGNDFPSLFSQRTSHDLSGRRRDPKERNEYWQENYDEDYAYEGDSDDFDEDNHHKINNNKQNGSLGRIRQSYDPFDEPRVLSVTFADALPNTVYSTSLDFRNTIDLREIGLEPSRDTMLDLARSQIGSSSGLLQSKLNITSSMASGFTSNQQSSSHHHHHHHYHHHHHHQEQHQHQQGWSNSDLLDVNFSFTEKSRSLPSLATGTDESTCCRNILGNNYTTSSSIKTVSSSSLFQNYTRVASVPVDLNLCGVPVKLDNAVNENQDKILNYHEMADEMETVMCDMNNEISLGGDKNGKPKRTPSVRTQKRPDEKDLVSQILNNDIEIDSVGNSNSLRSSSSPSLNLNDEDSKDEEIQSPQELEPVKSTVKTQDLGNNVLEMAIAMEGDIDLVVDEAIKQFKRQVKEAGNPDGNATILAMETMQRISLANQRPRRVKNNASYELAQQWEVDELDLKSRMSSCEEDANESTSSSGITTSGKRRVFNNASYELAQQSDYIKTLQSTSRSFQRMDACDELPENNTKFTDNNAARESGKNGDNILGQIKKNSDLFSVYGKNGSSSIATTVNPDDEVDFPCLETKPIGNNNNKNMTSVQETSKNISREKIEIITDIDGKNKRTMSFLGDFYPEINDVVRNSESKKIINDEYEMEKHMDSEESASVAASSLEEEKRESDEKKKENDDAVVVESHSQEKQDNSQQSVHSAVSRVTSSSVPSELSGDLKNSSLSVDISPRIDEVIQNHSEMSAVAAKRLAEASNPINPQITMKNDLGSTTPMMDRKERKGGLGGFLQRFSKLRFSGRSKVPRSEVRKIDKLTNDEVIKSRFHVDDAQASAKRKKEPDYIIIPLHAPEGEEEEEGKRRQEQQQQEAFLRKPVDLERSASCVGRNGRPPVCSSKPPLPPQGVRACAPSPRATAGVPSTRRRATTDLGSPAAIEMAKARAMQQQQHHHHNHHHQVDQSSGHQERPVGLLETDLDAETVDEDTGTNINITGDYEEAETSTGARGTASNSAPGKKTRSLLNLNQTSRQCRENINDNALRVPQSPGTVCRNSNDHTDHAVSGSINQRPHKSMEFLLDKENLHFVKPPENELQKVGERVPSEHELRVQRSLQRLNVPDWYKNSPAARDGFRLKRHSDASQHGGWRSLGSKTTSLSSLSSSSNRQATTGPLLSPSPTPPVFSRWSTSLLNSAGSSPASSARSSFNHRQPYLGWRSQERLANPRTPAERLAQGILPQLQSVKKNQQQTTQQLEVRNSIKEVTSAIVHYVQSGHEVAAGGGGGGGRLSPRPRPDEWDDRGGARSTSPRGGAKMCWMESSFVGSRPVDSPETPMSLVTDNECCAGCNAAGAESCSCADSATSGLYLDLTPSRDDSRHHRYLSDQNEKQYTSTNCVCPSPSSSSSYHRHYHQQQQQQQQHRHTQPQRQHRGSGQSEDDEAMATAALLHSKPSPGSTTLEDVLDSLLGLPPASRTPSPGPISSGSASSVSRHHRPTSGQSNTKTGKSCSDLRQDLQECARERSLEAPGKRNKGDLNGTETKASYYVGELVRRKSEGSDIVPPHRSLSRNNQIRHRRVSFDNTQENGGTYANDRIVRCRNNKCSNTTSIAEARKIYKSCHNCTYLYCSKECRRAHWQRHRKTCLHYRAGTLCRQILSSAKEDPSSLRQISILAKRGNAAHGRGVVKCLFESPEIAEQFVSNGFKDLGEPTYVRWSDLLPSEMGAELYSEVMRLCKTYNPDTRLVLYVAVCVVSEVPSSGAVRWERQLVSRCGKIRLDSSVRQSTSLTGSISASASSSISPQVPINQIQGRQQQQQQQAASPCNITREMDSPETLVLTSSPSINGEMTTKKTREIGFTNIQRHLRQRGVSLRRHFPQVYTKLCSYVDGSVEKFAPVTIYPRDQASGKSFMCIIMLDAEPERLQILPTDSSRVRTVDIGVEQE